MANNSQYQPEKEPHQVEDIFAPEQQRESARPVEAPEQAPETGREAQPEIRPEQRPIESAETDIGRMAAPPPVTQAPAAPTPAAKSPDLVKIESILSEHLDELYMQMTPEQQMAFRDKGEVAAGKIEKLMQDVKLKVREILSVIRDWLSVIPGVNKFFLEQEAKIKTDRLLALHEQKHKK